MTDPESLTMQTRLDGRLAVVTGAASGIGFAVARHLYDAGARLLLIDRNAEALEAAAHALGGAAFVIADTGDWPELGRQLPAALVGAGTPAILINAAGIFPGMPFLDIDETHWDSLLGVNLKGALRVSQIVAQAMRDGGKGGSIVHIGSVQGQRSTAGKAAYAASKAGLEALTRVMARELLPYSIRVNAVAAGPVLTEAAKAAAAKMLATPEGAALASRRQQSGIIGSPDEVARIVHFLASPAASYVTGAIWRADGGATLD